nr:hypothetical protein [Tanacetum cinerariifolium]
MVNTRTDADLSAAVQNALQILLPQIRAEIRKEFRTSSGPSDAGGNPLPVTIHTWLERFNKQKPHLFEKATAPAQATVSEIFETASEVADLKKPIEDSAGRRPLGWHLEEIHATWTQFGKKRTRIQLYIKIDIKRAYSTWRRGRNSLGWHQKAQATVSEIFEMASEVADLKKPIEDSAGRWRLN